MTINIYSEYPLSWQPNRNGLARPFYKTLVSQMKQDIKNKVLLPGTKLPPQRELADFLNISFTTITRAYKLSQQQGLTYAVVGQGTYISQTVNTVLTITRNDSKSIKELGFISSFESTNRLLGTTLRETTKQKEISKLLSYEEPTGFAKHKLVATKYLKQIGMYANPENTLITSGGQNALTIILMGLFRPGDKIVVNQFTYANFIELARLRGIKLIPILSDSKGMRTDMLEKVCQNETIQGIYLMPDCCNPTTEIMTNERRYDIAKLIKKYGLILIEDDYISFLNLFRSEKLIRMSNLVPDNSTYICSMSKPLVSGIRIAFLRVATRYKQNIEQAMFNINVKTSALDADVITRALENGAANKIMKQKLEDLVQVNEIFDCIFNKEHTSEASFFRSLPLPSTIDGRLMERELLKENIRVFHSDRFLVGSRSNSSFMRVSLSSIEDKDDLKKTLTALKISLQI